MLKGLVQEVRLKNNGIISGKKGGESYSGRCVSRYQKDDKFEDWRVK